MTKIHVDFIRGKKIESTHQVKVLVTNVDGKNLLSTNFYIEIQRHNDLNEKSFEKFNLNLSYKLDIPIIASHEVFYIDQSMHDAHEALICIREKTYVNEKNRLSYSDQHYLKPDNEMKILFQDIPEALLNNYNLPFRINFRPLKSDPVLPNISSNKDGNADTMLSNTSLNGLNQKFKFHFCNSNQNPVDHELYKDYKLLL